MFARSSAGTAAATTVVLLAALIGGCASTRPAPRVTSTAAPSDARRGVAARADGEAAEMGAATRRRRALVIAAAKRGKSAAPPCLRRGARACFRLGFDYERGRNGKKRDRVRALALYRLACTRSVAAACTNLGFFYSRGLGGLTRDAGKALRLYRIGCDGGSELGCSNLGVLYEQGRAVKRDHKKARHYYRVACDRGVALACSNLGGLYRYGRGIKRDRLRALDLYRLACDKKLGKACRYAAWMIARGDTAAPDINAARQLLARGCTHKDKRACKTVTRIDGVDKAAAAFLVKRKRDVCRWRGLWQPRGGVLWTSGRAHFPVGTLRWSRTLVAAVALDRKGEARVVLDDQHVRLRGELTASGAGPTYYVAELTRAASGVLWLGRGVSLRLDGTRGGKLRTTPRTAPFEATPQRPITLACSRVTLVPGLPGARAATWPDGGAASTRRDRIKNTRKAVAVYAKPGGRRVGQFVVRKYGPSVQVLAERGRFAKVRYRAYRYGVVGWVRKKDLLSSSQRGKSGILGALVGGVGGLGLVGRAAAKKKARSMRCARDIALFAQQGQQIVALGALRADSAIRTQPSEVAGYTMVSFAMSWLQRERGVAFVVRSKDLQAHCKVRPVDTLSGTR